MHFYIVLYKGNGTPAFDGHQKEQAPIPPAFHRDKRPGTGLSEEEYRFLKDISDNPTSSITDRYSRLNLSVNKGNSIKEKLIENKFISPLPVSVRKGKVTLLQIERKGEEYLRLRGDFKQSPLRYGGLIHQFWIDRIATQLRDKGFDVQKEHPIGKGKTVDIFAQKDNRKIIVEVETGKSDYMGNYEKLKNMKDCEVIFVFTGRRQKAEFEKAIGNESIVKVYHISENLTQLN